LAQANERGDVLRVTAKGWLEHRTTFLCYDNIEKLITKYPFLDEGGELKTKIKKQRNFRVIISMMNRSEQ